MSSADTINVGTALAQVWNVTTGPESLSLNNLVHISVFWDMGLLIDYINSLSFYTLIRPKLHFFNLFLN